MNISHTQFELLADVVRRRSGLLLPAKKTELVKSKLAPVAARFGFRNVGAMLAELEDEPEELAIAVTEAMTTNETSFFRDPACFAYLRDVVLPALKADRAQKRRLRIWCSAASTGQEPYSIAMMLLGAGFLSGDWKIDLFATDLSSDAVARTREGFYSEHEVQRGLKACMLAEHFTKAGDQWRIADNFRRLLRIRRFNLLDSYRWLGEIDIVLCRNVLMYFDDVDRRETLVRLEASLAPDGWLVLGATESAAPGGELFVPAGAVDGVAVRGLYVKARNAAARQAKLSA